MNLLEIKDLKLDFGKGADAARAVDGISLTIGTGETVCLVGESGCGKSVTAQSIARLVPTPPGPPSSRGLVSLTSKAPSDETAWPSSRPPLALARA